MSLELHRDPAFFLEVVRHKAAVTGFLPRLMEKHGLNVGVDPKGMDL